MSAVTTLERRPIFRDTEGVAMDSDLQAIVDRLNRENAQAAEQISRAQRNAFQTASELAARMGSQDPTLRRVVLFGSTIPGRRYRADSDIDLAVEGGDRAHLERIALSAPQSVDIVGMEELRPGVRERVLAEGIVLYEAQ
jgi:predicted nucleotidyltransferase